MTPDEIRAEFEREFFKIFPEKDLADYPEFLRGQRVLPRVTWRYRVRLFCRHYAVELYAALVSGVSAALIVWWARGL